MGKHKAGLSVMRALRLSEADLEANQAGRLGDGQCKRLKRKRLDHIAVAGIFLSVTLALLLATIQTWQQVGGWDFLLPLIFTLILGGGVYKTGRDVWLSHRDIQSNDIATAEGRVDLILEQKTIFMGTTRQFQLRVNDLRFTVDKDVLLAFKNDEPYQVYYAPHSKMLLGAEWLREDDPFLPVQDNQEGEEVLWEIEENQKVKQG